MTDRQDTENFDDAQGLKRRRVRNYGNLRTISLRMAPNMHERMMVLCDDIKILANT